MAKVGTNVTRPVGNSSRSKREAIIYNAIELFGREGYENSKWADVAGSVGIGSTALYHYFESKLHCLYVIMAEAVEENRETFLRLTRDRSDYSAALSHALRAGFHLTEHEVLRMRLLVAEQGLIGVRRSSQREEGARLIARERMRDLEFAWSTFLVRGMEQGVIPEADPAMLARAVLGLNTSVFHWYRPGGTIALKDVADFFVRRQLAVIYAQGPSEAVAGET
jgi:AcrR family transcriptional regulator